MWRWSGIIAHLKAMRRYIAFSAVLFLAGLVVGATNQSLFSYLDSQVEAIRKLSSTISETNSPTFSFILFIFLNNAIKAVMVIYAGAALAVFPIFFLILNGMIIGYLLHKVELEQGAGHLADLIFRGLLPHGILEIPAIIVASAYGIKFGALVWKGFFNGLKQAAGGAAGTRGEISAFVQRSIPVAVLLVAVLLVAAVIESTLTRWLIAL
ncbi:stage II sporulation protein M [Paenibacillus protaetiae]|uniref:Stage II sporulation protein M n=1 Tax=Paenibacillus protaetiae TaxID=2509456 RepID=A0A4P6EYS4_9BACL|nr:stage II sporulation protein M [Paenibacillus protaetiae]QAY67895.1 stage II sporulation protein M [Paenibacillus protaetiae]